LLAMLGLGAVNVHGLVVGDRNHEHGGVSGLAIVVAVATIASVAASAVGRTVGITRDGLEVGEDGVLLGLARAVCVGRGNTVVLREWDQYMMCGGWMMKS
jgi:hypothetical protein